RRGGAAPGPPGPPGRGWPPPGPSRRLRERQAAAGEARPPRRQHGAAGQALLLPPPLEHDQHGRRPHVAVLLQHGALMIERALIEAQCALERSDHLGAAGMAGEAVDRLTLDADARQDAVDGGADMLLGEWRNGAVEDDAEPGRIDLPSHDVEAVG